MALPTDRDARNALPVWDGCLAYFPDAWAEIAKVSVQGNKQHNIGPLHWNRSVSIDHENKVLRHMLDHAAGRVLDEDGTYHLAKAAWRLLAALQLAIEAQSVKPPNDLRAAVERAFNAGTTIKYADDTTLKPPTGPPLILKLESEDPDHIGRSLESLQEQFKP